jgi:integrase
VAAVLAVHPVGIRPTTRLSHTQYIERFLIPHLGKIRLAELTARGLTAFFAAVGQETNRFGQPHTPTTLAHIRTTLRAALNSAIRTGLIRDNPARQVELPSRRRAHALVWTPGRVADWYATGIRPTIAVWTAAQLAAFLDSVRQDRLYALWWLAALRGLHRGEVAGLRWADLDLDLDHRQLVIVRARTTAGYQVSRAHRSRRRAPAPSPWTGTPSPCCGNTPADSARNATPPAADGATPDTCSPTATATHCTPDTSPTA